MPLTACWSWDARTPSHRLNQTGLGAVRPLYRPTQQRPFGASETPLPSPGLLSRTTAAE